MARPLRIEYAGACYHVMNRGNRRQTVFAEARDYELFLERLGQFGRQFDVRLWCYCCMPNHFHLYLRTEQANLSRFMQSLLTSFTITLNRRHHSSGHVFQGRFTAHLVENEAYGGEVSRYIHLNPVRTQALRGASVAAGAGPAYLSVVQLFRLHRLVARAYVVRSGPPARGLGRQPPCPDATIRRVRRGRLVAGPGQSAGPSGRADNPGDGELPRSHSADLCADAKCRPTGAAGF